MKLRVIVAAIFGATVAVEAMMGTPPVEFIKQGKEVYAKNCAVCHGVNAQGKGKFPSLRSGHVSHHSPKKLLSQIENGGGGMPPFKDRLTKKEIRAVFAYIHSLWSDKMKEHYRKKFHKQGGMMR